MTTARLVLREARLQDNIFILELLNDPGFIQNIGDREVRTLAQAENYISTALLESYEKNHFGLYIVETKEAQVPLGICGLLKRSTLEDVDIGFAFLSRFTRQGFAYEAATAVMSEACDQLKLQRVVAITSPHNLASARLLEKLGFHFEKMIKFGEKAEELKLFSIDTKSNAHPHSN